MEQPIDTADILQRYLKYANECLVDAHKHLHNPDALNKYLNTAQSWIANAIQEADGKRLIR